MLIASELARTASTHIWVDAKNVGKKFSMLASARNFTPLGRFIGCKHGKWA